MGAATKHPVPDLVKPSFVIFDIWALCDPQPWASEYPDVKNYKWQLNPVWHKMLCRCTCMATVGVKGLTVQFVFVMLMNGVIVCFAWCWVGLQILTMNLMI